MPRARLIIAETSNEAARRNATPTGERVFLALLNVKDGIAERVLLKLGVSPDAPKVRLLELMDES
jgi:Clp amino terminal domain, pathogenicity island component